MALAGIGPQQADGFVLAEPLRAAIPEPITISSSMVAAAQRERVVSFYTAMEIPIAEKLADAFEAKYPGITVRLRRSGAERVFDRIGKEEEMNLQQVDVVCSTNAGHFIHWKRDGLLAPFLPDDTARNFPNEQIDPDGMYAIAFATLSPIGYNTNLVKPEDAYASEGTPVITAPSGIFSPRIPMRHAYSRAFCSAARRSNC